MALITSANAREMAAKANEAIAARKQELRDAVEVATQSPAIDYGARRLARVRVQIDRLDKEIDKAITGDSKRLKELCDAVTRLYVQEQQLANRPLPGTLRPNSRPAKRGATSPEPMPEPQTPGPDAA